MITKNFKATIAWILQRKSGTIYGYTPIKTTSGTNKYLASNFIGYPSTTQNTLQINSLANSGIWLGSGNNAASEDDYALQTRITTGLASTTPTQTQGVDLDGNPWTTFLFTLTNTTANPITVSEIGYVQNIYAATTIGGSCSSDLALMDRTVLSNPVTIPANGSAAIEYTLKTIMPSS
jgi:hypothetical protein